MEYQSGKGGKAMKGTKSVPARSRPYASASSSSQADRSRQNDTRDSPKDYDQWRSYEPERWRYQ
jgi:hypothetical protein